MNDHKFWMKPNNVYLHSASVRVTVWDEVTNFTMWCRKVTAPITAWSGLPQIATRPKLLHMSGWLPLTEILSVSKTDGKSVVHDRLVFFSSPTITIATEAFISCIWTYITTYNSVICKVILSGILRWSTSGKAILATWTYHQYHRHQLLTGYNVHWLLKYYTDNNYDHNKPTTVKQQYGHGHRDAILPIANSHLPRVEDATFHQVSVECE